MSIIKISQEEYRKAAGVAKSDLDKIDRSPAHFKHAKREETDAMRIGSLVHQAVLENDQLNYVTKPRGMNFATKEGKAWRDSQTAQIITQAESDMIGGMMASVRRHPIASKLIADGLAEMSVFALDGHGTERKCRPDFLPHNSSVIVDLKTCEDARQEAFSRSVLSYRYHVQAAYYLDTCRLAGEKRTAFQIIAIEKSAPFAVVVYQMSDDDIELGRALYNANLQTYRNCLASDKWPSYSEEIELIGIPEYAKHDLEEVI